MKTPRSALVTLLAIGLTDAAQANLLINGSFESGNYTPGEGFVRLSPGSTDLTGWTVGGDGVDWHIIVGDAAHFGHNGVGGSEYAVDLSLNYSPAGSLSQSFSTVPGGQYRLSFLLGAPWFDSSVQVTVGDASQAFSLGAQTQYDFPWAQETLLFTATGPTTTLLFQSVSGGFWGPVLDNVDVSAVPEPSTAITAGMALLGTLALWGRRRTTV